MVDDGAVLRVIDDVHGDKLGAEGHDVEFGSHRLVRIHHLRNGLSLHPPPGEFKHGRAVFLRCNGCKVGRRGLKDEHSSTGRTQMHQRSHPDVYAI